MITKETEIWYHNKYGNKFRSEEEARVDEEHRDTSPWKVVQTNIDFGTIKGQGIEALNDFGQPWTGQMGNRSIAYLFNIMIP
jgi:hypothetical protein